MSKAEQEQFWQLADCKAREGEESSMDGIWRTNNFALGQSGPRTDNGLFLRTSRWGRGQAGVDAPL